MYKWLLGFRYLISRKIIFFCIAGIMVGVTALIVVTSVMGGFSRDMRERIRGVSAHLSVSKGQWSFFDNYESVIKEIESLPHVKAAAPRIEWGALMGRLTPVKLIGIDPVAEAKVGKFAKYLLDGKTPDFQLGSDQLEKPGAIVGDDIFGPGFASQLVGRKINFITVGSDSALQSFLPQPISQQFVVVGRFKSGMYEYDSSTIYVPLEALQRFLGTTGVTKMTVALDDYKYAPQVRKEIKLLLAKEGPFYVRTWEDEKRIFLTAVSIEKNINAVILFCIVIVAAFNTLAMLTMRVVEKTRDIGVLKALGGTTNGIMSLFLCQGLFIAGLGSGFGVTLGLLIVTYLNEIEGVLTKLVGFKLFPSNIYQLDKIPSEVDALSIAIIVMASVVVTVIFSIYPAVRAARLDPIESLRYE